MGTKTEKLLRQVDALNIVDRLSKGEEKALLIGASDIGRGIYRELGHRHLEDRIALWIDARYNFYKMHSLPVSNPCDINEYSYSMIIVAGLRRKNYALEIIENFGLESLPVYYATDENGILEDFPYSNIKYTDEAFDENSLICIEPCELISENRLDIIIRYMACKEILSDSEGYGVEMYKKLMMSVNGFSELLKPFVPSAYFSDYSEKNGQEKFIDDFKVLSKSMQKKGFDKKHFIPVTENMVVLNGAHRLATALALNINVYVKKYVGFGEAFHLFNYNDLKEIGFTEEQLELISNAYQKLFSK